MTARGDARKRLAERSRDAVEGMETWPAYDEHADILVELAETQAALHAATNDVVRLAAELHTAHGQVDRVREVSVEWSGMRGMIAWDLAAGRLRRALDGGAS